MSGCPFHDEGVRWGVRPADSRSLIGSIDLGLERGLGRGESYIGLGIDRQRILLAELQTIERMSRRIDEWKVSKSLSQKFRMKSE